jgi:hypothetical protein
LALLCALAAATALLPPQAASALTLGKQDFTCPIGGEKFSADVVNSYTRFGIRLDLRPIGAMLSPIPLPVCPGNGFVMFKDKFTPEEIKAIEPIVLSDDYRRARKDNVDRYMVAFMRERLGGATAIELGRLYQMASWEAEGRYASDAKQKSEKPELVARYRALAIEKFDSFLKNDHSLSQDWWTTAIVTAELERMLGRFDAAEQRIAALPMDKLAADSPMRKAIDQIRAHIAKRNAEPERFVSK